MPPGSSLRSPALAALGLDLESTLDEQPHFLLDVCFLGVALQLVEHLGHDEAPPPCFSSACSRSARRRLVCAPVSGSPLELPQGSPATPRLAIRLAPRPSGPANRFEIRGEWPERQEASAHLTAIGSATGPICRVSSGYTSGWLSGIFDLDVLALEVECAASGDPACRFIAREATAWRETTDPRVSHLIDSLPLPSFRQLVAKHLERRPEPERRDAFEAGAAVVHVWGPVMVIPFSSAEESLRALALIGRDPGARDVRVVIVDLSAPSSTRASAWRSSRLDAIERWGAEPILAGISPLSDAWWRSWKATGDPQGSPERCGGIPDRGLHRSPPDPPDQVR
jgi:hypothetical protein